jgi:hypothetical protein
MIIILKQSPENYLLFIGGLKKIYLNNFTWEKIKQKFYLLNNPKVFTILFLKNMKEIVEKRFNSLKNTDNLYNFLSWIDVIYSLLAYTVLLFLIWNF